MRSIAERESDWYFSSRGQCASWIDPAWLAQQQRSLPASVYAQLHLNQWVDGVVDGYTSAAEVDAAMVGDWTEDECGTPGHRYIIAVDLGLVSDPTVIGVAVWTRAWCV